MTIGNGNSMALKSIGGRKTTLKDMNGNLLELEQTLFIPNFKKKIISSSKLLNQGYQVRTWTKEYFEISRGTTQITTRRREGNSMYYFCGMIARANEINATEQSMEINEAHNKLVHMGEVVL